MLRWTSRVLALKLSVRDRLSMNLSSQAQSKFANVDNFLCRSMERFAELVVTETQGPVRLIGINRANKRNCVSNATALQLIAAFEQFESDDSVKVGILHGKGAPIVLE